MVLRAGFAGSTPAFLLSSLSISPSSPNPAISLHFVPAVFLRDFLTGFPRFSRWVWDVPLPAGSYGEYAECTPFSLYHCMDRPVFIYCPGQLSLARRICPSWRWEFLCDGWGPACNLPSDVKYYYYYYISLTGVGELKHG